MRTVHYRLLAALWTTGIMLAMSIPAKSVGGVASAFGADKIAHVVLFAAFGGLWLRGLCPPHERGVSKCFRWRGGILFGLGTLFAVGTEAYQSLLPIQRTADPYDAAADLIGLILAFAGYYHYFVRRTDQTSV